MWTRSIHFILWILIDYNPLLSKIKNRIYIILTRQLFSIFFLIFQLLNYFLLLLYLFLKLGNFILLWAFRWYLESPVTHDRSQTTFLFWFFGADIYNLIELSLESVIHSFIFFSVFEFTVIYLLTIKCFGFPYLLIQLFNNLLKLVNFLLFN